MGQTREINACQHRFTPHLKCLRCGQYNYKNQAIKTAKYCTPFHFNLRHYLNSLRKSSSKVVDSCPISEETHLLLASICDKFLFTHQTLALGLYIYQLIKKLSSNEKFWASSALIVAAKAVQLDKNVPYINRYQRYAQKSFSQQQYEQAERTIFETMNFQIQYSTFITFLDFYLTCGAIFKEDGLNNSLVEFFEVDVMVRAQQFLRKGTFTKYDAELLALGIIKETRQKYNLKGWNSHLQELAGYCEDEIIPITLQDSPLREINTNNHLKLGELKGLGIRKKYESLIRQEKPTLQKYTSASKNTSFKENSCSASKLLFPCKSRKPSHNFTMDSNSSINSELLSRRR